jgi:hypothetical protein
MYERDEQKPKKDQIKLFMNKGLASGETCGPVEQKVNDWLGEKSECIEVVRIALHQESGMVMVHYRINK